MFIYLLSYVCIMVREGYMSSVYLRGNIREKIDQIVVENKEIYRSRSQLINSLCYKFLREQGKIPKEEMQ